MLFVAGFALIYPGIVSHGIGLALVVLVLVSQWLRRDRGTHAPA
jgi:UPF0716 family protein affecting phage T7 exclusion